jgi:hypothetical protein
MTVKLAGRVKYLLENVGESPWLPELTEDLAALGWNDLYRRLGLTPYSYATARVMACDSTIPRRFITSIPANVDGASRGAVFNVETLEDVFARVYERKGVKFYTDEEISVENIFEQLAGAVAVLKYLPQLCTTVFTLVKSVHLINTDDDYDVSFSEPHIPFTIFISAPRFRNPISVSRMAEAMVHEAMHLQLTLVEQVVDLIKISESKYFSPWRGEYRSPQGVLHAIYVFRVIDRFFEELIDGGLASCPEGLNYMYSRRREISKQMQDIKSFLDCADLTELGANFVKHLLPNNQSY